MTTSKFQALVWRHYRVHGRHDLPWRKSHDAYRVLVSEIMLQQTQVERVAPFYKNFLKKFPTVQVLARAPLSDVLKSWQGLGYNRRAKMLHQAAKESVMNHGGGFPKSVKELEAFPGIGPYTARAVAAFAYNQDVIMIETNIRTVIINHFFPNRKKVSDTEIEKILMQALPKGLPAGRQGRARGWYSALMDYGAHLKRSGTSLNARSRHHVKQSKFSGSLREVRGAILRELAKGSRTETALTNLFSKDRMSQVQQALQALTVEGLIQKRGKAFALPR